uniref:Uncharacterized protein n=1 Tax=Caenorhabditis japonica TaxID=281687 RepID=A0A8R1IHC2_CAEJA
MFLRRPRDRLFNRLKLEKINRLIHRLIIEKSMNRNEPNEPLDSAHDYRGIKERKSNSENFQKLANQTTH